MLKRQNSRDAILNDFIPNPPRSASPALREARAGDVSGESPARRLQAELDAAWAEEPQRWSARRTLAFSTLVCGAFWVGAALALRAVL